MCTRHPPLPPAFDSWPPASHQQIAHGLGHPPEPGLTEPPLSLESPARWKPAAMFLRIRSDIYSGKLSINFSSSLCFLWSTFCFQFLCSEYRTVSNENSFRNNSVLFNLHFVCTIITLINLKSPTSTIRLCLQANQNHLVRDLISSFSVCCDKCDNWSKAWLCYLS